MELNTHPLLIISILSLILSSSSYGAAASTAQNLSPEYSPPAPAPVSYISSPPEASAPGPSASAISPEASAPVSYISSTPASAPAPSPGDGGHVSFVVGSYVKKGVAEVEQLLEELGKRSKDPAVSPLQAECYEQCVDNYNAVLEDLKKAQEDMEALDFYMVNESLSSIASEIDACQDCFKEMAGKQSPVAILEESIRAAADAGLNALPSVE